MLTFLPNFSAVEKNLIMVTYTYWRLGCSSALELMILKPLPPPDTPSYEFSTEGALVL